jgi:type II secretory ATPase GspE/PulE/Tfp pilus assembly ATPase PilB-like protein
MVPSSSNPSQLQNSSHTSSFDQASEIAGFQTDQMFRLIDSILPFEACLYYRFLPVALEGKYLRLAMVAPQDTSALDYARRILAYLNCSLKLEEITPEIHQSLLSAYLNYTHHNETSHQQPADSQNPAIESEPSCETHDGISASQPESQEPQDYEPNEAPSTASSSDSEESNPSIHSISPSEPLSNHSTQTASQATAVTPLPKMSPSDEAVPLLDISPLHLSRPMEFIATLAPPQMLQELLGRVLIGGIGRLYFERQSEQGRILWSQDGVLQSVLEGLALPTFQGLVIELKRIFNLPLLPVVQPKQLEIERRYQQECLLLRLRVMPGTYGEEATLQVLRGVALKFYQRQQIEKLGQDALKLAQQLQRKLTEIRDRSYRYPLPVETLPALNQQLRGLDQQLEAIAQLYTEQDLEP